MACSDLPKDLPKFRPYTEILDTPGFTHFAALTPVITGLKDLVEVVAANVFGAVKETPNSNKPSDSSLLIFMLNSRFIHFIRYPHIQ